MHKAVSACLDLLLCGPSGRVSRGGGGGTPAGQSVSDAQEGAGRVRNLGTELAEARAESRRGRTLSGLIAEGGLSHGVHVRAHREGRERRGKSACRERKFTRRRGGSKSWTLDPSISCQGFGYPVSHPSPRRPGSEGCTSSSPLLLQI